MHRRSFLAGATAAAFLAACSGDDDESAATAPEATDATTTTASTTTTSVVETSTSVIEDEILRQPLTGVVVESEDELITRPALVVKMDNRNEALANQSGLAVADLVFEEIVEGTTRFAAVFHTLDSDPVGPIRSGREQDVDMLSSLNAPLFAWSGGNPGVTALIANSFLTDLNPSTLGRGAYYRGPGRKPFNFYSSTQALYALTPPEHPGAPNQQFAYVDPGEEFDGEQVVDVDMTLRFEDVRWEWDPEASGFARYRRGERHVDVVHGDIFATNVIVMVCEYGQSTIDSRSPNAQTLGSGPVYVFSNGQVVTGRWQRQGPGDPIGLVGDDGEPIGLTPGNTWIEVADLTGDAAFVAPPSGPGADGSSTTGTTVPFPTIDLLDPESAPTDITIRLPEISEADST